MLDYGYNKKLYMISMFLVLIAGLNDGTMGLLNFSPVRFLSNRFHPRLHRIILLIIGIATVTLFFCKWVYVPHKGPTLFPTGLLNETIPVDWTEETTINIPKSCKVVYWANESSGSYGKFMNSGVAKPDINGTVILRYRKPSQYIKNNTLRDEHIHYRVLNKKGVLGPVKTLLLKN
jgi:uncharacterized membrane protein YuzA (DUF378 family)